MFGNSKQLLSAGKLNMRLSWTVV